MRLLVVLVLGLASIVAIFLLAAVAAYWRGPYRDDANLRDTRPRKAVR